MQDEASRESFKLVCGDGPTAFAARPPVDVPPGHVGPVVLPGSGRLIWWTGRVAIGLRHQPERYDDVTAQSALWIQELMLKRPVGCAEAVA